MLRPLKASWLVAADKALLPIDTNWAFFIDD